jgi:hypothetical protein
VGRRKRIKKNNNPGDTGVVLLDKYDDWKKGDIATYTSFDGTVRRGTIAYFREYEKGTVAVLLDEKKGMYLAGYVNTLTEKVPPKKRRRRSKKKD